MNLRILLSLLFLSNFSIANYKYEVVLDDLDDAWSIVFLDEKTILYTELPGNLKIANLIDKSITTISNVPKVHYASQGGLSEVVLDPDFESNRKIYLSYSAKDKNNKSTLFLSSAELVNNSLINNNVIFEAKAPRRTSVHIGAKIAFLNDGTLLLNSGDGFDHREKAQYLDNHFGKIIRINKDGSIPADNPFTNLMGALPEIYTYGHRNMQGLIVTSSGEIYEHEHGPKGGDEININNKPFLKVKNFGWPISSYGEHYKKNYSEKILKEAPLNKSHKKFGFEEPIKYFDPSIGISQTISLNEADTEFLIGAMGNEIADQDLGLHYIKLNEKRNKVIEHDYFLLNERVRDMVVSKDKKLIIIFLETTSSISILKKNS